VIQGWIYCALSFLLAYILLWDASAIQAVTFCFQRLIWFHAYSEIFIHCHTHWMFLCNSVMIPSGHMTSMSSIHPGEGSSSVALLKGSSLFSPWKLFSIVGSFSWSDVRSWDVWRTWTDCKALWGKFVILGCTKWTELNWMRRMNWLLKPFQISESVASADALKNHTFAPFGFN